MSKRRYRLLLPALCLMLGLLGCGSGNTAQNSINVEGLDKLGDIQVISREDGSGTRSAFAQLVDFEGGSAEQSDLTREDAQIANDAQAVMEAVQQNTAAIGYVSKGALSGQDGVKVLSVGGVSDDKKNYPLSRSFYVAYCGELSELEQDFLTYIHSAGQEIIGESYTPVAKSNTFLSNKASGSISIKGSTSVAPLMENLAETYQSYNPNASITVEASDSTDGLTQAMAGTCDFGMSSRDLKDYEAELLDYEAIAQDDIAVLVNAENPLEDITIDMLKKIYTGEIKGWDELNA